MEKDKHSRFVDETGKKYGRLTVLEYQGRSKNRNALWLCLCECGNTVVVKGCLLRSGTTKSCGCLKREIAKEAIYKYNSSDEYVPPSVYNIKHGMTHDHLYKVWLSMKRRCIDENHDNYRYYGGRGIKVCEEWANDFITFMDWAYANGYDSSLTIDRIDVNGNYCPNNCRWVPFYEQIRNRRNTVSMEYNNQRKPLKVLCDENGVPYKWAHSKYKEGYNFEQIIEMRHKLEMSRNNIN